MSDRYPDHTGYPETVLPTAPVNKDTPRTYGGYTLDRLKESGEWGGWGDSTSDALIAHIEELQAENKRLVDLTHQMDTNLNFGTLYAETEAKLQAAARVVEGVRDVIEEYRPTREAANSIHRLSVELAAYDKEQAHE